MKIVTFILSFMILCQIIPVNASEEIDWIKREISVYADSDIEFLNTIDEDIFSWQGNVADVMDGRGMSKAKVVTISDQECVFMYLPEAWRFMEQVPKYLSLWVKGGMAETEGGLFQIRLLDETGQELSHFDTQVVNRGWENIVFSVQDIDMQRVRSIQIIGRQRGKSLSLILDDILLTSRDIEKVDVAKHIVYENDFDTEQRIVKTAHKDGWTLNFTDGTTYTDTIYSEISETDGVDGSACMKIDVSAATMYSGQEYFQLPTVLSGGSWNLTHAEYLEFDIRVEGEQEMPEGNQGGTPKTLNFIMTVSPDGIQTETEYLVSYKYRVILEDDKVTDGTWQHVRIPFSAFAGLQQRENIVGFALAPDAGPLTNKPEGTLIDKEVFNRLVKMGTFYLDNLRFTGEKDDEIQVRSVTLEQNGKKLESTAETTAGMAEIITSFCNRTGREENVFILVGIYDRETMQLKRMARALHSLPAESEIVEITTPVTVEEPEREIVRVMLWKDMDTMCPINTTYEAISI